MGAMASQITRLNRSYGCRSKKQRKLQSRLISRTNDQKRGKCFHFMTSSWFKYWQHMFVLTYMRSHCCITSKQAWRRPFVVWCRILLWPIAGNCPNSNHIKLLVHVKTYENLIFDIDMVLGNHRLKYCPMFFVDMQAVLLCLLIRVTGTLWERFADRQGITSIKTELWYLCDVSLNKQWGCL